MVVTQERDGKNKSHTYYSSDSRKRWEKSVTHIIVVTQERDGKNQSHTYYCSDSRKRWEK